MYSAEDVRQDMGEPFASVAPPDTKTPEPAFEFVEL
jgi:hypothetical protein